MVFEKVDESKHQSNSANSKFYGHSTEDGLEEQMPGDSLKGPKSIAFQMFV